MKPTEALENLKLLLKNDPPLLLNLKRSNQPLGRFMRLNSMLTRRFLSALEAGIYSLPHELELHLTRLALTKKQKTNSFALSLAVEID
ncbi:MAG: hypothetical protein ACJAQ6_000635 [Arenicella sp.]